MQITLNGEEMILSEISIEALIEMLNLDVRKLAVECNLAIVPKSEYSSTILADGDNVEIVYFIGGG